VLDSICKYNLLYKTMKILELLSCTIVVFKNKTSDVNLALSNASCILCVYYLYLLLNFSIMHFLDF
jgi:hypothetical protein